MDYKEPVNGWTGEVTVVKWHDADTPTIEISREFAVRLADMDHDKDFNAPELNTPEGKAATKFIGEFCQGKRMKLTIPTGNPLNLMDINSFNRIVGMLFVEVSTGVWRKVTDILFENGFGEYKKF